MRKIQWILYDQCNLRYIQPGITDIVFFLYTPASFRSSIGKTTLAIRSRILEYAIARSFLAECETHGYTIHWIECITYHDGIEVILKSGFSEITVMRPADEFLARRVESWNLPLRIVSSAQFLISREEFSVEFATPPVMEKFYRYMRKTRNILLEKDGNPVGGKWNYDHENRSFDSTHAPSWSWFPEAHQYITEAKRYFDREDMEIRVPTTRKDALVLLEYFLVHHAHDFGRLEDAMYQQDSMVHHSGLSTALNFGLIHPDEIVEKICIYEMPLASKEAYIRQIIGWREYVRQFYLFYYESICQSNVLNHQEKIPESWWNYEGVTRFSDITTMNCVDTVLHRVQERNYSHHIERLMIVGNYSLLRGYNPIELTRWFYEMYTDAFEWVVVPNVMSMSQYSDGGLLATKPYISGGNYIDKMSNFCDGCQYSVRDKTCPMTFLYWDFVERNQPLFRGGRTPYVLTGLAKIDREGIRKAKEYFIQKTQ